MRVAVAETIATGWPPMRARTLEASLPKPVPRMVTVVPAPPIGGKTKVTVGVRARR